MVSLEMRTLRKESLTAGLIAKMRDSIKCGRWALNCGSRDWFDGESGVFFPDQSYSADSGFGYLGTASLTVARDVAGLKPSNLSGLFRDERYDIAAYRFDVPDGKYKVKLYMKWGFERGFKPGASIVTIDVNGKKLAEKLDFHVAQKGDFTRAFVLEAGDVKAVDGRITINFKAEKGVDGKVITGSRMVNAIEVVRQ